MRHLSADEEAIKVATGAAFEALGGVSQAARILGVASSTLSKYASTGEEWAKSFIRFDLAVALDQNTSHPFMLDAMTALVRGNRGVSADAYTDSALMKLNMVLDDVTREMVRALDDGRIDAHERQAVGGRIVAAQEGLARLFSAVMAGG